MITLDMDMEFLRRLGDVRTAAGALDEAAGWDDLAEALKRAVERGKSLPEPVPCALEAIGRAPASGDPSLGSAVVDVVVALEHLMVSGGEGAHVKGVEDAVAHLLAACGDEAGGARPTDGFEVGTEPSLDSVASFLVQMEPLLVDSITALRERFAATVAGWSGSDDVKAQMAEALEELDQVVSNPRSRKARRAEAVERVSHILEVAMLEEEDQNVLHGADAEGRPNLPPAASAAQDAPEVPQAFVSTVGAPAPTTLNADPELVLDFVAEGLDYLDQAEEALLALEADPTDQEAVNLVFRAFHTIKGVSAFLELNQISGIAHEAETLLAKVREGTLRFTETAADLFLRSSDVLRGLLVGIREVAGGGTAVPPDGLDDLLRLLADPRLAEKVEKNESLSGPRGNTGGEAAGDDEAEPGARKEGPAAAQPAEDSVRIRTERLDRLVDLVGELVVSQSMISQDPEVVVNRGSLRKKVDQSQKIIRELQDLSTSLRMVPLKPAFHKISRVVRDVSRKSGKKVDLVALGDDTELDRSMVAVITDPLVHMVRNSVDHGVETPEERRAKGKPERGTIRLTARQAGGSVVIDIEDDGKGLDRDKLLAKARERGLVDGEKVLSDREIFELVFSPGFSTAEKVTDISGRGVGMDVVKRAVESLRGRIEIHSEKDVGTRFSIFLPLTLAITDGMLVRVGQERYIVPTVKIQVSLRPTQEDMWTVSGRGEMVMLHGSLVPVSRLHRLFDISGAADDATQAILVVVGDGDRRTALLVDELLGQQQFVVKPLTGQVAGTPGVAGGAILGDGGVGLILDPEELIDLSRRGGVVEPPEAAA